MWLLWIPINGPDIYFICHQFMYVILRADHLNGDFLLIQSLIFIAPQVLSTHHAF